MSRDPLISRDGSATVAGMTTPTLRRLNRWALSALFECSEFPSVSRFATELEVSSHSTVFDLLSGRRDASEALMARLAEALECDVKALSADPFGIVGPLLKVAEAARELAPHLNGHDFGLRAALAELDEVA